MPEPVTLHPRLGRRIFFFCASLFICVIGAGAITSGAGAVGGGCLAIGLYALVFAAPRLFAPHAYETDLDASGFRVHDSFGRVVHDVPWSELEQLRPVTANAPGRPGGDTLVGFKLRTPPARRRWPRRKGVDGVLSDPYDGYDAVVARMKPYIEQAAPVGKPLAGLPDFERF